MSEGLWDLAHDADALDRAATTWTEAGRTLSSTADDIHAGASSVLGAGWEGLSADMYDAHRRLVVGDADLGAGLADQAAELLRAAAGSVRTAQGRLDGSFGSLAGVERSGSGDGLAFQPAGEEQTRLVETAIADAEEIRGDLDATLTGDLATLDGLAQSWTELAARWETAAGGERSLLLPAEADQTGILVVDGVATVNTGQGSDQVVVVVDPLTGDTVVTVNGTDYRLPPGTQVEVRGGAGDDTVTGSGPSGVTVLGGAGNDDLNGGGGSDLLVGGTGKDDITGGDQRDRVFGGEGNDYLDGQDGGDLVDGGLGDDTVYGLGGRDTLSGGDGEDYLEGGEGSDEVIAGAGDDLVSGGHGDDTLLGGDGNDVLYAGTGSDHVDGGAGGDTSYSEEGDSATSTTDHHVTPIDPALGGNVAISGSPEFQERVRADLALLAASPRGQELLQGIADDVDGGSLLIRESVEGDPDEAFLITNPGDNSPYDYELGFDPEYDDQRGHTPPSVVLAHELVHLHDQVTGHSVDLQGETDGVGNGEWSAAGLPFDHDGDPSTADVLDPGRPWEISENGVREEFGVDQRDGYTP